MRRQRSSSVLLDKKSIYVVNEGNLEEKYKVQEFMRHPNRTFRRLQKYAEKLKGEEKAVVSIIDK